MLAELRRRLSDLSWYMRSLNEPIARRANEEDRCTGRFWEGRFKSQPILDEAGLLACCAYVDLNPVRAGIAATPEEADFTAIQQRLQEFAAERAAAETRQASRAPTPLQQTNQSNQHVTPPLHPFAHHLNADPAQGLPFRFQDYVELVDWTARIVRDDHKKAMPEHMPAILIRLGFSAEDFQQRMQSQAMTRGSVIGQVERLQAYAHSLKKRCVMGTHARRVFERVIINPP